MRCTCAGGVVALALLAVHIARGRQRDATPRERCGSTALYWDFVAIVWVAMYVTVYWL